MPRFARVLVFGSMLLLPSCVEPNPDFGLTETTSTTGTTTEVTDTTGATDTTTGRSGCGDDVDRRDGECTPDLDASCTCESKGGD